MKTLRAVLIVIAFLLLLVDLRAVEYFLHGPDVLYVGPDETPLRTFPHRLVAGDYAAIAILLVVHAAVAFSIIRTRRG